MGRLTFTFTEKVKECTYTGAGGHDDGIVQSQDQISIGQIQGEM